jgi:hypothetical protein
LQLLLIRNLFPNLEANRILFTPNFAAREEYELAFKLGVHVNLDNIYPLRAWGDLFANREVFMRIDPGEGHGHHAHVRFVILQLLSLLYVFTSSEVCYWFARAARVALDPSLVSPSISCPLYTSC